MSNLIPSSFKFNSNYSQENLQTALKKSQKTVTENFENNSVGKIVSDDNPSSTKRTAIMMVPPLMLLDNIVDKGIGSSNNLLKKIASIGDKLSHTFNLDKILSKKSAAKVSKFLKNNRFFKYFTNDYKAVAKSPLAKSTKMSETYTTELISNIKDAMNLPEYSEIAPTLTKKTKRIIDFISQGKNNSKLSSSELVNTADELINKGIDTIKEGGMLSKHASLSSTKNKLITAQLQMGDTALGSACAKTALKSKNVLTYGGGLLSLYFTASALLNAYKASQEAPKGEKKSTFMHVLSEQYVGLILFQPSINLFYKICGNKYRGMTKDSRNFLKDLVKAANTNETITKEGIKIAKLQRNLLIKGVDKSKVALLAKKSYREAKSLAKTLEGQGAKLKFWEKPLKFAGKILSLGLDNIKKAKTLKLPVKLPLIGNKIKLPKPTASGVLGGAIRFAIIMFVLQPLLQKPITKLTHKIFGEPKTYLAKQKQKERDNETQFKAETNPASYEVPKSSETNLIKLWTNK